MGEGGTGLSETAAQAHAALAVLALAAAAEPMQDGYRSLAHQLTVDTGVALETARELIRVGQALAALPCIRAAFQSGELSFDKVRALTLVATPADDEEWRDFALYAAGSQVRRVVTGVRRAFASDAERMQRRGLWSVWTEDGMLRLRALLPPEEGAMVLAALEAVITAQRSEKRETFADDPFAARQADALVDIAEHALAVTDLGLSTASDAGRVVVHMDAGGESAYLEDGPPVSTGVALRIACDAEVITVTERGGVPVDVGRAQRVPGRRLRRALHLRDRGCRAPGCGVPARRCHVHHIRHWAHGGETTMANTLLLCHFHHRRLHDGALSIEQCLAPPRAQPARGTAARPSGDAKALEGGPFADFGYVVQAMYEVSERARAGP